MTTTEIRRRVRRRFWSRCRHSRPADLRDLLTAEEALALARRGVVPCWAWVGPPRKLARLRRQLSEFGESLAAIQEALLDD